MRIGEHYAVVPGRDGGTLLLADGRLPCVRGDAWRLPDVLDLLEPLIGRPTYLRLAAYADLGDDRTLRLHVFDAAPDSAPPARFAALDDALVELVPLELRNALARWLDEQRGAPVPARRAAWARPGWHAGAEAWVGVELRPIRLWPLSAVLCGDRPDGTVYLKAVFPLFQHEPALTQALAREHPHALPELLAVDRERGWMLMRELPGVHGWEVPGARWAPALRSLGEIQRAWIGRGGDLAALGAQDRGLASLAAEVGGVPELERCLEQLDATGLPETVGHGDFHSGNLSLDGGGRTVIFDWSDACLNHPLFDLAHFLHHVDDEHVRGVLVRAWTEGWGEPLPPGALDLAAPLSCVHQSVSYREITASLDPEDRWLFEGESERWLESARQALARGNASQPG